MHLAHPCKIAHIFLLLCLWNIAHDSKYLENPMNGRDLEAALSWGYLLAQNFGGIMLQWYWRGKTSLCWWMWVRADSSHLREVTCLLAWPPKDHASQTFAYLSLDYFEWRDMIMHFAALLSSCNFNLTHDTCPGLQCDLGQSASWNGQIACLCLSLRSCVLRRVEMTEILPSSLKIVGQPLGNVLN